MPIHPLSNDQPESGENPEVLHLARRNGASAGWWWAMTVLLVLVTVVSSTLLSGWLARWLFPPPALDPATPHCAVFVCNPGARAMG